MRWDLEDVELVIGSCFDVKLKGIKVSWTSTSFRSGVHSKEPVVAWLHHPGKISDEQEAFLFNLFAALRDYFLEHFKVVDECSECVRTDDAVNFLWQLKRLIKDVSAHKFKLVCNAHLLESNLCIINHFLRNIKAIYLLSPSSSQLLSNRARTTPYFEECFALNSFFLDLVYSRVITHVLHNDICFLP